MVDNTIMMQYTGLKDRNGYNEAIHALGLELAFLKIAGVNGDGFESTL